MRPDQTREGLPSQPGAGESGAGKALHGLPQTPAWETFAGERGGILWDDAGAEQNKKERIA